MKKLVQLIIARPVLRYPLLILVCAAICGLGEAADILVGAPGFAGLAVLVTVLLGTVAWIVLAVLDRRRMIWRQLLIWLPGALATTLFLLAVKSALGSDPALVFFFLLGPELGFVAASLIGSIAALIYRPAEGRADATY